MAQQNRLGKLATTVRTENGITKIQYHQTEVVSFDDKYIWLDTGGWYTATTKTRMTKLLVNSVWGLVYTRRAANGLQRRAKPL